MNTTVALLATILTLMLPSAINAAQPAGAAPPAAPSPFGVAWGFLYGYFGVPAPVYMPQVRDLGADFTKVYLIWQQVEPERGRFDWTAVDAFVGQLHSPEEGLISIFSSSQWATATPSAMLPPSPAKNLDDYYHFVFETVKHCQGRVRYWQNDAEPNNPMYWAGTKEAFVAQLKVFHRAVKDADPNAIVIVGGYDGLFVPPNLIGQPGYRAVAFPQQAAGLAFFDYVIKEGSDAFDLFDLRLYGDPYTIEPRIDYIRSIMRGYGHLHPIICTEYGGPSLFELPENRQYVPLVTTWSQAVSTGGSANTTTQNPIARLYSEMPTLAPQTQMFMQGCSPELEAKYQRIQARGIVMRNLFGLSSGVERMLYWQLIPVLGSRDDLMVLMYGKIGLLGLENGELKHRTVSADAYALMAHTLAGVRAVRRIPTPQQPDMFVFEVDRGARGVAYVTWQRRDMFSGEDSPAVRIEWPAELRSPQAIDALGVAVPVHAANGRLSLSVGITPIFVTASE